MRSNASKSLRGRHGPDPHVLKRMTAYAPRETPACSCRGICSRSGHLETLFVHYNQFIRCSCSDCWAGSIHAEDSSHHKLADLTKYAPEISRPLSAGGLQLKHYDYGDWLRFPSSLILQYYFQPTHHNNNNNPD